MSGVDGDLELGVRGDVSGVAGLVEDVQDSFVPDQDAADTGGEDAQIVVE